MSSVALIIIYNHQYNKNIDILEQIYGDRFSDIYHLVPFYVGEKKNVIPVYENSYYFQGYISQGLRSIIDKKFIHYFFIADDLILNPVINENNYADHLKLDPDSCFLPGFITLHKSRNWWARVGEAYRWSNQVSGVEITNQLPSYSQAIKLFEKFDLEIMPLRFNQIWQTPKSFRILAKKLIYDKNYFLRIVTKGLKSYKLSYPMVGGYSDILVVNSKTIRKFSNLCGVFAATRLFVELAIPTSLVLSAEKIIVEENLNLRGKALWSTQDYLILDQYNKKLKNLLNNFPNDKLYLHPIKLSKWDATL